MQLTLLEAADGWRYGLRNISIIRLASRKTYIDAEHRQRMPINFAELSGRR